MFISVIIPTYHEEAHIEETLLQLYDDKINDTDAFEVIIADASNDTKTKEAVEKFIKVYQRDNIAYVKSEKGRAKQLNIGASKAIGDVFFFLHADVRLPSDAFLSLRIKLSNKKIVGGGFHKTYIEKKKRLFVNIIVNKYRIKWTKTFWGNEGIFVRKEIFQKIGGFPDIELMEDVEFSKAMKKQGEIAVVDKRVKVSARRYLEKGHAKQAWKNMKVLTLHKFGVSHKKLKKFYEN